MMNADLRQVYKRLAEKWRDTPEAQAARCEDHCVNAAMSLGVERKSGYDYFLRGALRDKAEKEILST